VFKTTTFAPGRGELSDVLTTRPLKSGSDANSDTDVSNRMPVNAKRGRWNIFLWKICIFLIIIVVYLVDIEMYK
jgi:t-SNARE complex subunit (syntaxin)